MTAMRRQTIAIVGAGLAGWMTAAILARRLPRSLYNLVVISDGIDETGVSLGEPVLTTMPSIRSLHAALKIDEDRLIRTTGSGFSLGIAFTGWGIAKKTEFLPVGAIGAPLHGIAFSQLAARTRSAGQTVRFANYSVAAVAAQAGRFARPPFQQADFPFGFQIRADLYRASFRRLAEASGVRQAEAPLARARIGGDGAIATLELADGETIDGMLYIDCSGPRALLARGALNGDFESWRRYLPCNRVDWRITAESDPSLPYTHVEATQSGWISHSPVPGAMMHLRCWNKDKTAGPVDDADSDDGSRIFECGRLSMPWRGNCVALGAAAGLVEPIHPFGLHLLYNSIFRLTGLLPRGPDGTIEAAEYNRRSANELDCARDVIAAHYAVSSLAEDPARWPTSLDLKMRSFRSRGRVPMFDDEVIEDEDWAALFDLLGLRARRYDTRAEAIPNELIERHFAKVRDQVIADVREMPAYADVLNRLFSAAAMDEA